MSFFQQVNEMSVFALALKNKRKTQTVYYSKLLDALTISLG